MSSFWASAQSATPEDVYSSDVSVSDHPRNLPSIVAAVGRNLPILPSEDLIFDKSLGRGTSFEVNREIYAKTNDKTWMPYYVAVKHMVSAEASVDHIRKHYDVMVREIRVLTHPGLNDHRCIMPLIAYGWTEGPQHKQPYLVVEYSDHGTLTQYLQRIKPTLHERRELALDVAVGLKALHDSKVIHGDVKPSNILVFDTSEVSRPQMAKLSDFGGSIFELDLAHTHAYGGTAMYNAPEQEGRGKYKTEGILTRQDFYHADIYSFGLTVWEVIKNGVGYFEDTWLLAGEARRDALYRMCDKEEDGILTRAEDFCKKTFKESMLAAVDTAVRSTFSVTLRDDPHARGSMSVILEKLGQGTSLQRPLAAYPSIKQSSLTGMTGSVTDPEADGIPRAYTGQQLIVQAFSTSLSPKAERQKVESTKADRPGRPRHNNSLADTFKRPISIELSHLLPEQLDLFRTANAPHAPWEVQCSSVRSLERIANRGYGTPTNHQPSYFEVCLQLAICYYVGFGVQPNLLEMNRHLVSSAHGNEVARAIYDRVVFAFNQIQDEGYIHAGTSTDPDTLLEAYSYSDEYYSRRIWTYQRVLRTSHWNLSVGDKSQPTSLAYLVENEDLRHLAHVLKTERICDRDLSAALNLACSRGSAESATLLCAYCKHFVVHPERPNPLHWLIMFDSENSAKLGNALVFGSSGHAAGPCKEHINNMPKVGAGSLYLPQHCAEFIGTPLHWAVRARNLRLVQIMIGFGADVNAVCDGPPRFSSDVSGAITFSMTPLDIAVAFHLPEIAETLLHCGARISRNTSPGHNSAFHCFGQACIPLSRQVIHGRNYRAAARKILDVLTSHVKDGLGEVLNGFTALEVALSNPDCEDYIVDAILHSGAFDQELKFVDWNMAVILAIEASGVRRYNVSSLALLLPLVHDINKNSKSGKNAIHWAAIIGSEIMADMISNVSGFDPNAKTADGDSPMHLAAGAGSTEIVSLLAQKHAEIEALNTGGITSLHLATARRKKKTIKELLGLGAEAGLVSENAPLEGTILHAAVGQAGSSDSLVRYLLETCSETQSRRILNATDANGRTALHKAASLGDHDAVDALLAFGADRALAYHLPNQPNRRTALDELNERLSQPGLDNTDMFNVSLQQIKRLLENERST